jgi:hypothetical protein
MSTEIVALVSGAVLGIAGIAAGIATSALERRHQRESAHETRLYERRAAVYVDLLVHLHTVNREVQGANPVARDALERVAVEYERLISTETKEEGALRWKGRHARRLELTAEVAAFGSAEVQALVAEFFRWGESFADGWQSGEPDTLDEAAAKCASTLRAIESRIRIDLAVA